MKNGIRVNRSCPHPNPERESVVDQSKLTGVVCSTPYSMSSEQAVPGGSCPVIAPSFEQFGKFNPAKKRKRLIARFPAVTVRTIKNAFAPQFLKTFNLRHFVNDSGCQQ